MENETTPPFRFWPALALVVVLLLGLVGASYYLTGGNNPTISPGPEIGIGGGPDDNSSTPAASLPSAASNPLYGQSASVSGEVASTRGPRMFLLRRGTGADDTILVITRDPVQPPMGRNADDPVISGDNVNIVGTLKPFIVVDLERELGFDFDRDIEAEFENQPVIVADNIQITPQESSSR